MKKTLLASAVALSLGSSVSVQAQTITITNMKSFIGGDRSTSGTDFKSTGTMNSNGDGYVSSNFTFLGDPWAADQQNWFETHSSTITWAGTGTFSNTSDAIDNFSYTFDLTSNQVAVGTFFDWGSHNNIPILTIYDCPAAGGGVCTGQSLAMVTGPFPGTIFDFNGTTNDDFPVSGSVPVPAAVWLMGSGLLGLVSVARRRKF